MIYVTSLYPIVSSLILIVLGVAWQRSSWLDIICKSVMLIVGIVGLVSIIKL